MCRCKCRINGHAERNGFTLLYSCFTNLPWDIKIGICCNWIIIQRFVVCWIVKESIEVFQKCFHISRHYPLCFWYTNLPIRGVIGLFWRSPCIDGVRVFQRFLFTSINIFHQPINNGLWPLDEFRLSFESTESSEST